MDCCLYELFKRSVLSSIPPLPHLRQLIPLPPSNYFSSLYIPLFLHDDHCTAPYYDNLFVCLFSPGLGTPLWWGLCRSWLSQHQVQGWASNSPPPACWTDEWSGSSHHITINCYYWVWYQYELPTHIWSPAFGNFLIYSTLISIILVRMVIKRCQI